MKYRDRTIATIDLGTNSILLLVIRRSDQGDLHVLHEGSEVVRLGENLNETHTISNQALERTIAAIEKYQSDIKPFKVEKTYLTATSAMREALNQVDIAQAIYSKTTLEVEILPKVEEARLSYKSVLAEETHDDPSLVIDIGGGSTEVCWGIGSRYDGGRSLNLGTIKLIEGPLSNANPTQREMDTTRDQIDNELKRITPLGSLNHYYGTAGSFTQAAALEMKIQNYTTQAVDHFRLKRDHVSQWISKIAPMSIEERKKIPGIDLKRLDVLLPGLLIIERLYQKFQTDEFIVRDRGIRFGKAFDQFRDFKPQILFS